MPEQVLRDRPAAVLLADEVRDRHFDVVEEDLVDVRALVERLDRAARRSPGVSMSISRNEMPCCGLPSALVRTRQKNLFA